MFADVAGSSAELQTLLDEVVAVLLMSVTAVLFDGQHSIRDGVEAALPDVPHQLCQSHDLCEAAWPLWEAHHAKKEPKK